MSWCAYCGQERTDGLELCPGHIHEQDGRRTPITIEELLASVDEIVIP